MASLAQINVKFSANLSEFSSQMQTALRETEKVGKEMQKVGAALSIGLSLPILAIGAASVKMASDFDESVNKVDVAFGDSNTAVKEFADTSLEAFGIAKGSALDMAALFGDMATSMEIPQDEAAKLSTSLVGLAGDLASFKNIGIDQATTALNGVFTGETESLKRLGIVMTEANLQQFALAQGIKKTTKEMSQAEKVQLRYAFVMDKTQNAQGDFSRTSGGAANQMRIFQERLKELGNEFGQIILPAFTSLITSVNSAFKSFGNLSDGTKKTIVVVAALVAAIGPLVAFIGTILTLIPSMVAGFVAVKTAFAALTASIAANPLGAIAVALGLVVGALYAYSQANKEVVKTKTTLEKIEATASDNLAKERVNLERLVKIAKDESKSKTERLKAIKDLNKLSPEYLGNLTLESINTDKATTAVENYTAALLKKFRVEAAENELKELANKRIQLELGQLKAKEALLKQEQKINSNSTDLERKAFENRKRLTEEGGQLIQKYYNEEQRLLEGIVNGTEAVNQSVLQGNEGLKEREKLEAIKPIKATEQTGTISNIEAEIAKLKQFQNEVSTTSAMWQAAQKEIESLELKITIAKDGYASLIDSDAALNELASNYEAAQQRIAAANEAIRSQAVMVAGAVGDAFTTLGENYVASLDLAENGIQGFAKVMIQTVTKLLAMALSNAIANSIVNATQSATATGPAAVFTQPAFIATAVGGVLAAFAAIPKFNDGGIVGGTSTYGDKILARVNSGELILNQRQQRALDGMLDQTAPVMNIGVNDVLIEGDKLRIVFDRAGIKDNRRR